MGDKLHDPESKITLHEIATNIKMIMHQSNTKILAIITAMKMIMKYDIIYKITTK